MRFGKHQEKSLENGMSRENNFFSNKMSKYFSGSWQSSFMHFLKIKDFFNQSN